MAKPTILLLEADDFTVEHISSLLAQAQFDVIPAASLAEAFETLKKRFREICMVILDFELATDDVNIFERLRNLDFDRPLPVVLMGQVPLNQQEVEQLCKDTGYAGYLFKSMPEKLFIQTIGTLTYKEGDRRKFPRVFYQTRVHVEFFGKSQIGETYIINQNGVFIALKGPLPEEGTRGQIVFGGHPEKKAHLQIVVEVVTVRKQEENVVSIYPKGVGVRFLNLNQEQKDILQELVEYQHERGKVYSSQENS